ncbi:3-deoxy-manno-octulosonate cytidylyltransferase [Sphingomonas gei]|uniref:3-deoxy-manno-octulosonate cytidylyltransferase n=1 Tax=Sphingomonas gei TaxID=1395960 RepID=A0A4S1X1B2_9SPHN|nr:3-deoxy-manno-octulosonate cytidylyltransferase [Sphingomonas gei]TGX48727.1 3-deoxy-manno-octulosonate cytidylyltransferase [Sphingomonas gei]
MLKLVGGTGIVRAARAAIIIPARFASSRFPGKPLVPLHGAEGAAKSLLQRSWEAARAVGGVAEIWIATDDDRIADTARRFGAQVVRTSADCANGTERCWSAICEAGIDADVIVNFQGDSPLTPPLAVELLIETLAAEPRVAVVTPMIRCSPLQIDRLTAEARLGRTGGTTVVFDGVGDALYFSKRVIPHTPERCSDAPIYFHLGVYAYTRAALAEYAKAAPSPLELVEGLEQLRFLHCGVPVRMVEISDPPGGLWEVNNPSDVVVVEAALAERRLV